MRMSGSESSFQPIELCFNQIISRQEKMPTCCVVDCENRTSSGVKFFRIPAGSHPFQKNRRHLWLQAIKRADWENATIKEARVCSAHFISGNLKSSFIIPFCLLKLESLDCMNSFLYVKLCKLIVL